LNDLQLANALKLSGYDLHLHFGDGHNSGGQTTLDLPESPAWLWRDYDPDRSEQVFEQDTSGRIGPAFGVRIATRDAW
jgi:enterochelin esterase family protein